MDVRQIEVEDLDSLDFQVAPFFVRNEQAAAARCGENNLKAIERPTFSRELFWLMMSRQGLFTHHFAQIIISQTADHTASCINSVPSEGSDVPITCLSAYTIVLGPLPAGHRSGRRITYSAIDCPDERHRQCRCIRHLQRPIHNDPSIKTERSIAAPIS
jgi:hypothetical protein